MAGCRGLIVNRHAVGNGVLKTIEIDLNHGQLSFRHLKMFLHIQEQIRNTQLLNFPFVRQNISACKNNIGRPELWSTELKKFSHTQEYIRNTQLLTLPFVCQNISACKNNRDRPELWSIES